MQLKVLKEDSERKELCFGYYNWYESNCMIFHKCVDNPQLINYPTPQQWPATICISLIYWSLGIR